MILTKKQEEGLKIAVKRFKDHEAYSCIAGYAGSGKSTLIKYIISALHLNPENVCYIAYTGKAALVLQEKGCPNAKTAHRLLYKSFPNGDGTFSHVPREILDGDYSLIVVDEVSMLPRQMWDLLLSHHIHVIALGDPGQLPPVGEDNKVLEHPHIFLDEIMRQAQDSEIIRLTMDIREGKPLQLFKGNEVQIISPNELSAGIYKWADQIIVGKNDTRKTINTYMRDLLHGVKDGKPIDGDKIICLRNEWSSGNGIGDSLVNGSIGYLRNSRTNGGTAWYTPGFRGDFIPDSCPNESLVDMYKFENLRLDYSLLKYGIPTVDYKTGHNMNIPKWAKPKEFDYAYAITCHKSQGSEYNHVLVLEEHLKGDDHKKWLYTAATRAKEKLVIVKGV